MACALLTGTLCSKVHHKRWKLQVAPFKGSYLLLATVDCARVHPSIHIEQRSAHFPSLINRGTLQQNPFVINILAVELHICPILFIFSTYICK